MAVGCLLVAAPQGSNCKPSRGYGTHSKPQLLLQAATSNIKLRDFPLMEEADVLRDMSPWPLDVYGVYVAERHNAAPVHTAKLLDQISGLLSGRKAIANPHNRGLTCPLNKGCWVGL